MTMLTMLKIRMMIMWVMVVKGRVGGDTHRCRDDIVIPDFFIIKGETCIYSI